MNQKPVFRNVDKNREWQLAVAKGKSVDVSEHALCIGFGYPLSIAATVWNFCVGRIPGKAMNRVEREWLTKTLMRFMAHALFCDVEFIEAPAISEVSSNQASEMVRLQAYLHGRENSLEAVTIMLWGESETCYGFPECKQPRSNNVSNPDETRSSGLTRLLMEE